MSTLSLFDHWFALEKVKCGVDRLEVGLEGGTWEGKPDVAALRVILTCPKCGQSIAGAIRAADLPQVRALLDTTRAN